MIKHTKEEIRLCRQVAEKWRKEIECGNWFLRNDTKFEHTLFLRVDTDMIVGYIQGEIIVMDDMSNVDMKKAIPLWAISDCLEFLRGKSGSSTDDPNYGSLPLSFSLDIDTTITKILLGTASVNDLNIACLKAVLAVLEEEE